MLVVDGHNVQITVESSLLGRPLLRANDGVIRDLAGQSANFRMTEASSLAVDLIFRFLGEFRPAEALFLFDAPISQSGRLAHSYQQQMNALGLSGTARAVPVPEREFPYAEAIIASSDQSVLEQASRWVDLAGMVLRFSESLQLTEDFSSLILARAVYETPCTLLAVVKSVSCRKFKFTWNSKEIPSLHLRRGANSLVRSFPSSSL